MTKWYDGIELPDAPFSQPMPAWARTRIERGWLREIGKAIRRGRLTPNNVDAKTLMILAEIMAHGRTHRNQLKAIELTLMLMREERGADAPPPVPPHA